MNVLFLLFMSLIATRKSNAIGTCCFIIILFYLLQIGSSLQSAIIKSLS
jgi:hypothetical protein